MTDLTTLESRILSDIAAADDEAAIEAVRVAALGRKGSISALLSTLGKMSPDERKTQGAAINLPTDLSLAQIAAVRAAMDVPLDLYVEAPDNVGGFVRHHEIPELIRVAAPVYVKFGLRNAPDVYPSGTHLDSTTVALTRERVRRARLGMELLARSGYEPATSELGAEGLAVPVP